MFEFYYGMHRITYGWTMIFFLILLTGAAFRFWGISYDLPHVFTNDESLIMNAAVAVADGNLRHGQILRGAVPIYIIGGAIRISSIFYPSLRKGQHLFQEAYQQDRTSFYIIARTVGVLYSILEIVLVYMLATIVYDWKVGMLSSFFLSIAPLAVNAAHEVIPDTAVSATMMVTILLAVIAYRTEKRAIFVLAAISSGIAAAQKFPGVLTLPLVCFWYLMLDHNVKSHLLHTLIFIAVLVGSAVLVYALSYPYILQDFHIWISEVRFENSVGRSWDKPPYIDYGLIYQIKQSAGWLRLGTGTFIFYASIIGFLHAFKRKHIALIMIGTFAMIFLLVNDTVIKIQEYRLTPLISIVSMFAAYAVTQIHNYFLPSNKRSWCKTYSMVGLILLVSLAPFMKSVFSAHAYASPDTRTQTITWVQSQHINDLETVRDLYTDDESIYYEYNKSYPLRHVKDRLLHKQTIATLHQFRYAIVNDRVVQTYFSWEKYYPSVRPVLDVYRYLEEKTTKIAEFLPQKTAIQEEDLDFLLNANRWTFHQIRGPRIMVYKLR